MAGFDIIGDIHGYAAELIELLERLGYRRSADVYHHGGHAAGQRRRVVFVGDFIDRGPAQREVVAIARAMVEAGEALAVMGNHELNALGWATPDPQQSGTFLRRHSEKNWKQHRAFVEAYGADEDGEGGDREARLDALEWFASLPLYLELDGLRVVHACWDDEALDWLRPRLSDDGVMPEDLRVEALTSGTTAFTHVETLLKGKEVRLPEGSRYADSEGTVRHFMRVKWWRESATYREAFLGPPSAVTHIPEDPIEGDYQLVYPEDQPPVLVGHYWLQGDPAPLTPNVACLDYSVARPGGKLAAYRWDGEHRLTAANFIHVPRRTA